MVKERISTRTIEETQNADQPQKNNLGGTSLAAYQKSLETIFAETNRYVSIFSMQSSETLRVLPI